MTVEYVQERVAKSGKSKSFRYRRKVHQSLKAALGKGEIVIPLGKTKADVLRNYDRVHREAEAILAAAWDEANGVKKAKPVPTALELYEQATRRARELLGQNPYGCGDGGPDDPELVMREVIADQIAAKYQTDPHTGYPVDVSPEDTALVRVLLGSGSSAHTPEPTVEDAKRLYLRDRFELNPPTPVARKKDEQRAERAIGHIVAALGRVPTIASLRRADARAVQSHMLRVINSPDTVERYLNDVRAIINYAIREYDLTGVANPFMGLAAISDNEAEVAWKKRKPFSEEQLKATRKCVLTESRADDLKLIWRLLEGTGCRLSEIAGLRVVDVVTEGEHPHIDVEWHEGRRIKTKASRRKVPLLGDTLAAAKEALAATGGPMLFPKYGREGGGDAASAALMKHVRAVTDDPKVVVHSLRHLMKDRLRRAKVTPMDQNLILGHSMGGIGETYGGEEERLAAAMEAMRKVFPEAGVQEPNHSPDEGSEMFGGNF